MTVYHIDTDMGVDDGLALLTAAHLPNFTVAAVSTVFGNVPVETATRNAILFRHLLASRFPFEVFQGAARPANGLPLNARQVHADDGLGGATRSLDRSLLDEISAYRAVSLDRLEDIMAGRQSPITLIGLGPATNIPRLVKLYGRDNVERIVLMAGVFFDYGNVNAMAEFNASCDPEALHEALALGIPTTLVPLDVCRKVQLCRNTVRSYLRPASSTLTRLIVESHMAYMDYYRGSEGIDGCFPHDSIAVMTAAQPEIFYRVPAVVSVEFSTQARGRTSLILDPGSHIEVITGGDLRFVRNFLLDLSSKIE